MLAYCKAHADEQIIVDEYGVKFTGAEFIKETDGAPFETTHIGKRFC